MTKTTTLKDLELGQTAVITAVGGEGSLRQHFLDMGVIPGAEVTLMKFAPMGDPMELRIHGYELTLRLADGEKVTVAPLPKGQPRQQTPWLPAHAPDNQAHPGLGEGGKYHVKADENPLPPGTQLTFALAGEPELRQDHVVQPAHRGQPACGQFPRRHRGPEEWGASGAIADTAGHRPAGHLLPLPLHQ